MCEGVNLKLERVFFSFFLLRFVHDSKVVRKVENQNGKRKHQQHKNTKIYFVKTQNTKIYFVKNQNTESKFCQNAKGRTLSKKNLETPNVIFIQNKNISINYVNLVKC